MAQWMASQPEDGAPKTSRSIARVGRDKPLALSLAQQRLWFLDRLEPDQANYNIPIIHRLAGPLNWHNPFVERFIGTLRRELLDYVIVLNQTHLAKLLRQYIEEYYHIARPHQGSGW
jgi:putative transposase